MAEEIFSGYTPITPGDQIFLERPRLDRLLEKAVQKPIVAIVAGAGYGKTCAVYSFVRKYNARTAWIQCSERDNVEERFWENFVSAISVLSKKTASRLAQIEFPATPQQFDHYLEIARKDIVQNEKYLLVYDDLHLITEKTVLRFLEHSLLNAFPNITAILVSRIEPAFDLAKPEAKKQISFITEDKLRFSLNEMAAYFDLRNIRAAPPEASALYRETEGWPIAIHLAGLSLKNISSVSYSLRSNIYKLIESEIMTGLSPELRRFLIKLSLIENNNADLVREIGNNNSLLREMEKIVSFIRFDGYINAYHIHHLFMDYLRERQDELSEEEKKDTLTKAALWCEENNRKIDAIIYYEKTWDYNSMVKIFNTLPLLMPVQMARFVFDILERAPENFFRDHPESIEIRIRTLNSLGLHEQSRKETLQALTVFRALDESPEKHRVIMSCYLNLGFIGLIEAARTRRYDFIDYFREARNESKLAGYIVPPPINGINLSSYACRIMAPASGKDIEEYIAAIGEIVPCSAEAMGGCQSGMHELALGEYAFFRGQLGDAEKLLRKSVKKARDHQQYEIENRALFYLLRICLCRGNSAELEKLLAQLKAQTEEPFFLNRYFYSDLIMGWYHIQTGRKEKAAAWLKSDYEESELNARTRVLEKLVKAKYYFSEKRYPAALAFLTLPGEARNREEAEPLLFGDIEMKALEAVCCYQNQENGKAYAALTRSYALAAPAGLFMPFVELGKDMRALAGAAQKDMAAGHPAPLVPAEWLDGICRDAAMYAKRQYRMKQAIPGLRQPEKGESPLSHREKEVLTGLSRGLTREEIAESASISPNTVKSVTRSIYNKLGALNQADAVRIAAEKGIL